MEKDFGYVQDVCADLENEDIVYRGNWRFYVSVSKEYIFKEQQE